MLQNKWPPRRVIGLILLPIVIVKQVPILVEEWGQNSIPEGVALLFGLGLWWVLLYFLLRPAKQSEFKNENRRILGVYSDAAVTKFFLGASRVTYDDLWHKSWHSFVWTLIWILTLLLSASSLIWVAADIESIWTILIAPIFFVASSFVYLRIIVPRLIH